MKSIVISLIIVLLSLAAFSQVGPSKPNFDTEDFSRKSELAAWLVTYDTVAWKTTDVLMTEDKAEIAKLGGEWFCFQDSKKVWHAVYGKLENDKYTTVFHYVLDSAGKISKTTEKIDQDFLNSHAKALITGKERLSSKISAESPRFNQYIRTNPDKTFDVWMFPAFQTNRMAVFGGEGVYKIDSTGTKVIADTSYFQKDFRGFKTEPPREIWLNYTEIEKPTLGSVFFVWYYKAYFTKIYIDTAKSVSTAVGDSSKGYIWVNVEKEDIKTAKPTPKP